MITKRIAGLSAVALTLFGLIVTASAQFRRVVPDDLVSSTLSTGDRIRFCVNPVSALADFDRAVGQYLADMLLVPAEFHDLTYAVPPAPLNYEMPLGEEDLFIQVSENCDAVLGYPLPVMDVTYSWLTVTSPYYLPGYRIGMAQNAPESLSALPEGTEVGSKIGVLADMNLRAFLRTSPNKLKRKVYPSYVSLTRDLGNGDLGAALVWEAAVVVAAQTDANAQTIRLLDPPFAVEPVQIGIGLPSNQTYLRSMLDEAIASLRTNGDLQALLEQAGLPEE